MRVPGLMMCFLVWWQFELCRLGMGCVTTERLDRRSMSWGRVGPTFPCKGKTSMGNPAIAVDSLVSRALCHQAFAFLSNLPFVRDLSHSHIGQPDLCEWGQQVI